MAGKIKNGPFKLLIEKINYALENHLREGSDVLITAYTAKGYPQV